VLRAQATRNASEQEGQPRSAPRWIEEREREKAAQRKGGRPPKTAGQKPTVTADTRTRDAVGDAVGMSGKVYEKAKQVVEQAEADPEAFGEGPGGAGIGTTGERSPPRRKSGSVTQLSAGT